MTTESATAAAKLPENQPDWCVYLLLCGDGSFYCGISNRPAVRFAAHLAGKGANYTRSRCPQQMRIIARFADRSAASKEEYRIKSLKRADKELLWQAGCEVQAESG